MAKTSTARSNSKSAMWCCWIAIAVVVVVVIGVLCWHRGRVSACAPSNLQLIPGQQSGAAGTIYQHMALKNTGQKRCTISGYPTAFLYGSDGYALGSAAATRPNPTPANITLDPGETAYTVLGYPQAGNFNPGVCSATSVSLKLYPPSGITPLETPLEVAWCPGFSATAMQAGS